MFKLLNIQASLVGLDLMLQDFSRKPEKIICLKKRPSPSVGRKRGPGDCNTEHLQF